MGNWINYPIGELLKQSKEQVEIFANQQYKQITVRMWGNGVVLRDIVSGLDISSSKRYVAREGQFILSRIDARHGAFGVVPNELDEAVVTNDFPLFNVNQSLILTDYLHWYSKTPTFTDLCLYASEGTTNRVRLKLDRFKSLEIPLPPLDEQRRIVAEIEALAERIETARGLRHGALEEAEALLASELGHVFDDACLIAGGTELLEDVCSKITDGTHHTPFYIQQGIPFLSVKDITSGVIDFSRVRYIASSEHEQLIKRCEPEFGDVLLTKVGTTGFAKWIDVERKFSIFVSLALLKIDQSRLRSQFVEYMLNSPRIRDLSRENTRGVGNKNLVLKFIKKFPIPVPLLEQQDEMIVYLDELNTRVNHLKHLQAQTQTELDALLPSILDKAFKGEL